MFKRLLAVVLFTVIAAASARADFEIGKAYYDKGNWIQAIINLRPLVEGNPPDARAMILLGNMYLDGYGVSTDEQEAFGLFHSAAMLGNTDGMIALAVLYQTGKGIPKNIPLCIAWYKRAALLGNQTAQFMYAIWLYQGSKGPSYDEPADHPASYKWFKIAAAGDDKKISGAAQKFADLIAKKITNDDVVKGNREAANWKPEMPEKLGPNPEDKYLKDLEEKRKAMQGGDQKGEEAPAPAPPPPVAEKDLPACAISADCEVRGKDATRSCNGVKDAAEKTFLVPDPANAKDYGCTCVNAHCAWTK